MEIDSRRNRPGYEKIPDIWYTRASGDEYTIPFYA